MITETMAPNHAQILMTLCLNKRCRPHLKPTNKSYRIDETYINVKG